MFKRIGIKAELATSAEQINSASRLILPGVGAFDSCMSALLNSDMFEALQYNVLEKRKPILGICVGYQMLTKKSEEGNLKGLGWLEAETVKFVDETKKMKIPHMGWNYIKPKTNHILTEGFSKNFTETPRAYFVHSYYVKAQNESEVILQTNYIHDFASGMASSNVMGVQFHPEKSHKFGMQLFKSFMEVPL
jgi:imidazole glycerol-phosphate synthase subunit HisH